MAINVTMEISEETYNAIMKGKITHDNIKEVLWAIKESKCETEIETICLNENVERVRL